LYVDGRQVFRVQGEERLLAATEKSEKRNQPPILTDEHG